MVVSPSSEVFEASLLVKEVLQPVLARGVGFGATASRPLVYQPVTLVYGYAVGVVLVTGACVVVSVNYHPVLCEPFV